MNLETIRRKFPLMKRARSTQPNAMFVIARDKRSGRLGLLGARAGCRGWPVSGDRARYFHISEADVREIFDTLMRDAKAAMQRQA